MAENILSHEIFCIIAQGEASVKQWGEKKVFRDKDGAPDKKGLQITEPIPLHRSHR